VSPGGILDGVFVERRSRMSKKMDRIPFERGKVMKDRLELIKERHKKVILDPRKKSLQNVEPDFFFEEDEFDYYEDIEDIVIDSSEEPESELF
jgi:hypothetical protein